jgi:PAS domain S-box-containing protein
MDTKVAEAPGRFLGKAPEIAQLIEEIPLGISFADATGAPILANKAVAEIWGGPPPSAASVEEYSQWTGWWAESGKKVEAEEWPLARAIREGKAVPAQVIDIERFDGGKAALAISAAPVRDATGRIVGGLVIYQDITEQRERERLNARLLEIDAVVSSSLRTEEVLERVLVETAKTLEADEGIVYARKDDRWQSQCTYRRSAHEAHATTTDAEITLLAQDVRENRVQTVSDTSKRRDHTSAALLKAGVRAIADVPVVVNDRLVANVSLRFREPRHFSEADTHFMSDIGFAIGRALRTAAQFQDEEEVANALQRALLRLPFRVPDVDVAYNYTSASHVAEVGGDFYDLVPLAAGRCAVVIGDVSGKALDAARQMMMVKNAIRAYAFAGDSPAEVLRKTNELLVGLTEASIFVTVFLTFLNLADGQITYCGGGHPSAVIRRTDGSVALLQSQSPLVGSFSGLEYTESSAQLDFGEYLFLYTDGALEARRDSEMFGEERLLEVVKSSPDGAHACERLLSAVTDFAGGRLEDDLAILAVSRRRSSAA